MLRVFKQFQLKRKKKKKKVIIHVKKFSKFRILNLKACLAPVWKVDWKRAGLEAGRPVRKLL